MNKNTRISTPVQLHCYETTFRNSVPIRTKDELIQCKITIHYKKLHPYFVTRDCVNIIKFGGRGSGKLKLNRKNVNVRKFTISSQTRFRSESHD